MKISLLTFNILIILLTFTIKAQKVELIYTKAGIEQALKYKSELDLKDATATNALSLMNISEARESAYLKGLDGFAAVLIFGDSGVKAVSSIKYNIPAIIINSNQNCSANISIVRIFDKDYTGSDAKGPVVADANSINVTKSDLAGKKEINLNCKGINGSLVVKKILSIISN